MEESPQDRGRQYERDFAARVGAKVQPGSGNKWFARMDVVGGGSFLWSVKTTDKDGFRMTSGLMDEVIAACEGPGGSGATPALSVRLGGGQEYVVLRTSDFIDMATDGTRMFIKPSKSDQRRKNASTPILMREDD